jgi:hypothetical protein
MKTLCAIALTLILAMLLRAGPALAAGGSTLARPADPVVLTGADVPTLIGTMPNSIVAFRYDGGWTQIPVQVDERFVQNFQTIYHVSVSPLNANTTQFVYADTGTYTGADPDPTLDSNDEIAFMAQDAGGAATSAEPAHVVPGSGVRVAISDPLAPGDHGWVYLFRQDGALSPGAGLQYVSYNFDLLAGPYLSMYRFLSHRLTDPPPLGNPEDSSVTSPSYSRHFGDRWQDDGLSITAGGASGVDILDRHKALFAPGNCMRSEDTFDYGDSGGFVGEGAFVINKSGPVRAIRSYIGANSGPNTERDDVFYAQREDIRTELRVHPIASIVDFFDYSPAASGMTYYNDLNPGGVTVDGSPDSPVAGPIQWEMVAGPQGSLVQAGSITTNIAGFAYTSYYLDDSTPPVTQCTGDAFAYGSSGVNVNAIPGGIPCTDPALGCTSVLNTTRTMYYLPPGATVSDAQALSAQAASPLTYVTQPYAPPAGVGGLAEAPDLAALPRAGGSTSSAWMLLLASTIGAAAIAGAAAARLFRRRARR